MTNKPRDSHACGLQPSLRPLVLAIFVAEDGIPRQRWAFVSLAEELLRASRPKGCMHRLLSEDHDPRRGFSPSVLSNAVLDLIAHGLLEATGTGDDARVRGCEARRSEVDAHWRSVSSSDQSAIHSALQRLEASSVALSKMRRASGAVGEGTRAGDPTFRHARAVNFRVVNS